MELNDTVSLMNSKDYKDRFKAEVYQLKIRYDKLKEMLDKWDEGSLDFTPTCPRTIYDEQIKAMEMYLDVLGKRAIIEEVEL